MTLSQTFMSMTGILSRLKRSLLINISPFQLLITPILLLLFLFPIELIIKYLKTTGPTRSDTITSDFMPIRLKSYFQGVVGGVNGVFTNQYGFRGQPDFPRSRPHNELRILSLGDSIGFGYGIDTEETYSRKIENLLNLEKQVRLINAAGQGYSPSSYLSYLIEEGFSFEPNLIMVQMEPSNDVTDEALIRLVVGKNLVPKVRGGRYTVTWDGNLLGSIILGPYFYEQSYLYTMLTRRLFTALDLIFPKHTALSDQDSFYYHQGFDRFLLTSDRIKLGWKRSFDAVAQISEITRKKNLPFILLLTPTRFAFHKNKIIRDFGNGLVDRVINWAHTKDISYIDLRTAINAAGGARLYIDFAHYTAEGHNIIGQEIARKIQNYLP